MADQSGNTSIVELLINEEVARLQAVGDSATENLAGDENAPKGYERKTYNVPGFRVAQALKHLTALSIKAVKLGMPEFEVEKGEPFLVPANGDYGIEIGKIQMVPLTVTGGPPILDGWRFLAKIDHDDAMNIVQGFGVDAVAEKEPGFLKSLQSCEPNCEHCNVKRNRNVTFVFQSTDDPNERIQVGSTCVDDFSGHSSPGDVISLATRWFDVIRDYFDPEDDGFEKPSIGQMYFEAEDVLAAGAAAVRQQGHWVSRDSAGLDGCSTDWVQQLLLDQKSFSQVVQSSDRLEAKNILSWLRSDDFDDKNTSYLGNLQAMGIRGAVPFKMTGFLASAVATWHREQKQQQRQDQERSVSQKLGSEKEKITLSAVVEKIQFIDNDFGGSDLTILKDQDSGAKMVWFNSGRRTMFEGDTYKITGTVKKHEQRDDIWQTNLTRVNSPEAMLLKQLSDDPANSKAVAKKIKATENINSRNGRGDTAILIASYYHQNTGEGRATIDALLESGADYTVRAKDYDMSPVDHWVVSGETELVARAAEEHPETLADWSRDMLEKDTDLDAGKIQSFSEIIEAAHKQSESEASNTLNEEPTLVQDGATNNSVPTNSQIPPAPDLMDDDDDDDDLPDIRLG